MEYGYIVLTIIIIAVVGGFVVLANAVVRNWRARSRGKESVDAVQGKRTMEFERCFNECMASENWDPDKEDICKARCTEIQIDHASIDKVEAEKRTP